LWYDNDDDHDNDDDSDDNQDDDDNDHDDNHYDDNNDDDDKKDNTIQENTMYAFSLKTQSYTRLFNCLYLQFIIHSSYFARLKPSKL